MIHGDSDTLVPFDQSTHMLDACLRARLAAKLIKVGNANHDFELSDPSKPLSIAIEELHLRTVEFFKENLRQ
jgi:hypothetical protein